MKKIALFALLAISLNSFATDFKGINMGPLKMSVSQEEVLKLTMFKLIDKKRSLDSSESVEFKYSCLNFDLENNCSVFYETAGGLAGSFFAVVDSKTISLNKIFWNRNH